MENLDDDMLALVRSEPGKFLPIRHEERLVIDRRKMDRQGEKRLLAGSHQFTQPADRFPLHQ